MADVLPAGPRGGPLRWILQIVPSIGGCLLSTTAVGTWVGGGLFSGLLYLITVDSRTGEHTGLTSNGLMALIITPLVAVLLAVAATLPGRTAARGAMLLFAAGVLLLGGRSCSQVVLLTDATPLAAWGFSLATYGAFAGIATVGGLALIAFTPIWMRTELEDLQLAWMADTLSTRGWATQEALCGALRVGKGRVRELAVDLVADGTLQLRYDERGGRLLEAGWVARRLEALMGAVATRGRARLEVLAEDVEAPPDLVEGWVDELVTAGVLDASVDRTTGEVVHAVKGSDGVVSDVQRWCAMCGGPLVALGAGLGRCGGCGREEEL